MKREATENPLKTWPRRKADSCMGGAPKEESKHFFF